ncbi:MAG TPA: acyl-ACP thioesterase domain-containing protein [Spirochaetia bacterium]|nr:acyl-ACP thioesterase domain-containing protein [Spirochaetia bacterium]
MSDALATWSEQRSVESFEVDVKARLKPHMLFAYMLNSAWKHATRASHGYQDLLERNQMWVLVKFQAAILQLPEWGKTIVIETWGKGIEKLFALRDFTVRLEQGEKLASATSAWMILDKNRHRPVRLNQMSFPWKPGRCEMETKLEKVPELQSAEARASFRAVYSDIDVNEHVTAMKYLQWIMDAQGPASLQERRPAYLEINFMAEAVVDDEVTVFGEKKEDHELFSVKRASDQKELCRAKIQWAL